MSAAPQGQQLTFTEAELETVQHDHQNDAEILTEAEKQMRDKEISFYFYSESEHDDDNSWGHLSGIGGKIYEW
jgi:hypothetical protein